MPVPEKLIPPPSPSLSIRERMGSLKRMINPSNRPLPELPMDRKPSCEYKIEFYI